MNKELQDLVWSILPKEFKEEVKKEYAKCVAIDIDDNPNLPAYAVESAISRRALLEMLFGHHNLTSDAEGEEMLMISRKKVQIRYHMAYECKHSGLLSHDDVQFWKGWQGALDDLFGSKCLPDDVATSEPNVDSLNGNVESLEPKPAEPRLRRGSFAYHDNVKVRITKIKANGDVIAYTKDGYRLKGRECDFEPYNEPGKNIEETRNLSQDCDKEFVNILKRGFSKERRLAIAAQMMQGLICAPPIPGVDPHPPAEYLAQTAFRLADALIAEAEKGGSK